MSMFTRKTIKDEIKDMLNRAENLYKHNVKIEISAIDSISEFYATVEKLKGLVEINVKDEKQ